MHGWLSFCGHCTGQSTKKRVPHTIDSTKLIQVALVFPSARNNTWCSCDYHFLYVSCRNSVPQSPNFPVANASAHEAVLQRVTEMVKLNFPYTTVYPALGNLDVLHPRILEASESSSSFGKTRETDHYRGRGQYKKKRRKWYGNSREHHETTTACEYSILPKNSFDYYKSLQVAVPLALFKLKASRRFFSKGGSAFF